jgi:hypothetical protein
MIPTLKALANDCMCSPEKVAVLCEKCLRNIMKIWWPGVISIEKSWAMPGQIKINMAIKGKFGWIGHTLRKVDSEPCKAVLQWNPHGTRGGTVKVKVKQSLYTPWRRLGGEEV